MTNIVRIFVILYYDFYIILCFINLYFVRWSAYELIWTRHKINKSTRKGGIALFPKCKVDQYQTYIDGGEEDQKVGFLLHQLAPN